ncbi:hypothetical protein BHE74_00049226 [Ensete ventricosum]|nr:hypothetical protein BHE74_00049226 [Ensete ventricosum]
MAAGSASRATERLKEVICGCPVHGGDGLYEELWRACAGPLVEVPRVDARVFYFPQGHLEQVGFSFSSVLLLFALKASYASPTNSTSIFRLVVNSPVYVQLETSTDQELNQQIPLFNLPPKILCRVVNINLKVSSIFSSTSVRFTGTITGIGDISSQWPGSKWRSLKVQWDEASSILRPEKISPWDVEPFGGSISTSSDAQAEPSSSIWNPATQISDLGSMSGIIARSLEKRFLWSSGQTESIDNNSLHSPSSCDRRLSDHWLRDLNSPLESTSSSLINVSLKLSKGTVAGDTKTTLTSWPPASNPVSEEPSLELQCKMENQKKPKSGSGYRLFGIDLVTPSNDISPTMKLSVDPVSQSNATVEDPVPETTLVEDVDGQSGPSKASKKVKQVLHVSLKEVQSKQNSSTRSCIKVKCSS